VRGVRGLRIGFIRHFHEVDVPADGEVTAALAEVARTLQRLGAEIRDVRLPALDEFGGVNRVILQSEAWAIHGPWLREQPGDYGRLARRRLMAGAFISAGDYVQAARRRLEMIAAVEETCAMSMCCCARVPWTRRAASTSPRMSSAPIRGKRAHHSTSPGTRHSR